MPCLTTICPLSALNTIILHSICFLIEFQYAQMKKILSLLVLTLFLSILSHAQDSGTEAARKAKISAEKARKIMNKRQDRIVVNFNFDNWIHQQSNGFATKWYSRGMDIYFTYDMPIKKSFVSFAPGIGYSTSNIYSNSDLREDSLGAHLEPFSNYTANFKKTKISLGYIDIPLELRFRSKPLIDDFRFKVAIGFKFGIKVDGFTKDKRNDLSADGTYKKYIEKGYKDLNQWRMGPTLRVGFGPVSITAYYGVLGIFKKDRGPKVTPFSVGLSINGL